MAEKKKNPYSIKSLLIGLLSGSMLEIVRKHIRFLAFLVFLGLIYIAVGLYSQSLYRKIESKTNKEERNLKVKKAKLEKSLRNQQRYIKVKQALADSSSYLIDTGGIAPKVIIIDNKKK